MIQRIQTLFLLLALICMATFFFFPFGQIITATAELIPLGIFGTNYTDNNGDVQFFSTLPVMLSVIISVLITLVSIFLYKKRILQIRFNIFNLILQLGSIGLMFYFLIQAESKFGTDYSTSVLIILPLIAAILTFLAIRAIARDEALVRSLNRLR